MYYPARAGIQAVDLTQQVLIPTALSEDLVGRACFLKIQGNKLLGVSKIDTEFELFSFCLTLQKPTTGERVPDYSPIAFDSSDGITAVLGHYRTTTYPRVEEAMLFVFDSELKLVASKEIEIFSKSAQLKIHPTEEPASDTFLQVNLTIVSGFEHAPLTFKLTYNSGSHGKKKSWKLSKFTIQNLS